MLTTTLNEIRKHDPCDGGWGKLLKFLGKTRADDEPLPLEAILKSNGLKDAIWALCTLPEYQNAIRLYACYCARHVLPIFERQFPYERGPRIAIEAAEGYARGYISLDTMHDARDSAVVAAILVVAAEEDDEELLVLSAAQAMRAAARTTEQYAVVAALGAVEAAIDAQLIGSNCPATMAYIDGLFSDEFIRLCNLEGKYNEIGAQ